MTVEDVSVEGSSPHGGLISVWTLNRPDKLNALNSDSHRAIKEASARANSDDLVRCVVIRGAPPPKTEEGKRPKPHAFAAGATTLGRPFGTFPSLLSRWWMDSH